MFRQNNCMRLISYTESAQHHGGKQGQGQDECQRFRGFQELHSH